MAGSRSLTSTEERLLIKYIRRIGARDRAVITTQLMTGFRVSEVLSLTIGQVLDANGQIKAKIGVRPKNLKGGYGSTRWVPVSQELHRALESYLSRRARKEELKPDAPLFLSRQHAAGGKQIALSRSGAEKLIRTVLRRVGQGDLERLSTHSLRKSYARKLYEASGHDLVLVKEGLGHSSVAVTQAYLSCDRQRLEDLIMRGDWTRRRNVTAEKALFRKAGDRSSRHRSAACAGPGRVRTYRYHAGRHAIPPRLRILRRLTFMHHSSTHPRAPPPHPPATRVPPFRAKAELARPGRYRDPGPARHASPTFWKQFALGDRSSRAAQLRSLRANCLSVHHPPPGSAGATLGL